MKAIRSLLAAILFATAGFVTPALATSVTTDQSDLWWVPAEPGWGIQFVQRDSIIFATMFVYDSTNLPIWYTATLSYSGNFVWAGDLYLTNGPWFGSVQYEPNTVGYRNIGTMNWTATSTTTGVLTYVVDGVLVVKYPVRQLLVFDNFSGRYGGAMHTDTAGCRDPALNGVAENLGVINITQSGRSIALAVSPAAGGTCSYSGTLIQAGQLGTVTGSYVCTGGDAGAFELFELQGNITGVTGRFASTSNTFPGCRDAGWLGGVRVTTF